jgi:hypothetical protein
MPIIVVRQFARTVESMAGDSDCTLPSAASTTKQRDKSLKPLVICRLARSKAWSLQASEFAG